MNAHAVVINGLQTGFPIVPRPFLEAARPLGLTEEGLLQAIHQLLKEGRLSRFGPLFNVERMGGGVTLAAMSVPADQFERVTEQVNAFPEVAHNYARDHRLNMWFVVATEHPTEIPLVLDEITRQTGHAVFNLPKRAEYRLGFQVRLSAEGVDTVPLEDPPRPLLDLSPAQPDPIDRAIVTATQAGLPLVPHPYHEVANQVGITAEAVMERLLRMLAWGWIRRLGVVPNHYALGLKGNGMTVWDLPDEQVDRLGEMVGNLGFVSHCYCRPKHLPHWPFNLFAMVHGPDRESVVHKMAIIRAKLGNFRREDALLHSSRILKKSGLRLRE
ncbi:MAG: hypothetical protein H7835_04260 [Magnetococcus sp. XQGC-1]